MNSSDFNITFDRRHVGDAIAELESAKSEMKSFIDEIASYTQKIKTSSLFDYCTALEQKLNELMIRAEGITYGSSGLENDTFNFLGLKYKSTRSKMFDDDYYLSEKERVYGQYYLDDINFQNILSLLENLRITAIKINNNLFGEFLTTTISTTDINNSIVSLITSSKKVKTSLQTILESNTSAQTQKWNDMTEKGKKEVQSIEKFSAFKNQEESMQNTTLGSTTTQKNPTSNIEKPEMSNTIEEKSEEPELNKNEPVLIKNEEEQEKNNSNQNEINKSEEVINNEPVPEKTNTNNNFNNISGTTPFSNASTVFSTPANNINTPSQTQITSSPEPVITVTNPEEPSNMEQPITITATPSTTQTSNKSGTNLGPAAVITGIGVAAAAGLGAKVYLDNKKNNNNNDDEIDEELEPNTDDIKTETWQEDDTSFLEDENDIDYDSDNLGEL